MAAAASAIVDGAIAAALDGSHPLTVHAKMLRLELLSVKGRPRARTPNARARLLEMRSDGAVGRWARCSRAPGMRGVSPATSMT
jgi:hypothetical protein